MQEIPTKHGGSVAELRQHFHNYFELLIDTERGKLLRTIANLSAQSDREPLLVEIDFRINFLRGAVKMGKLLCLIDQDEAKANYGMLSSERDRLRRCALGTITARDPKPDSQARFELVRKSIHEVTQP